MEQVLNIFSAPKVEIIEIEDSIITTSGCPADDCLGFSPCIENCRLGNTCTEN